MVIEGDKKMKVLLVSPLPPPEGGIAVWTSKYKDYCDRKNISLSIVNTGLLGSRSKNINNKRNYLDEIRRTIKIIIDLQQQLKQNIPDVVHINSSCSYFGIYRDALCVRIIKKYQIPIIFHCRCNVQDQLRKKTAIHLFRQIVRDSSKVLVLNSASFDYVANISKEKVLIIPNFIDEDCLADAFEIRDELKTLVFVGHVQKTKGFYEIAAVAEQLSGLEFLLIGPLAAEIRENQYPTNIRFLGAKPNHEIRDYLRQADVFLFPSYTEGFSNALVEAMAVGLPVITTNVGANYDMIEEYGGIIVPVGDYKLVIDAINKMHPRSVRDGMSTWNREKVRREYLIDSVMCKLLSIYEQVCLDKVD